MTEVILETERLIMRWFREEDYEQFQEMCANAEVMRFLGDGKPMAPMEVWRQMATFMGHWYFRGYGIWAVEEKDGTRIDHAMVNVRRIMIDNGQIVIFFKSGRIERVSMTNVVRMAIEP